MTDIDFLTDTLDTIDIGLAGLPAPGPWKLNGRCRTAPLSVFFPGRGVDTTAAKRICAGCPVLAECRQYALDAPSSLAGVWGGMNGQERREERLRLLSNPDPRAGWTPNSRTADHALHHILEQLLDHPGRWARIAQYRSPGTASMAASKLRTGRTSKPAGVWQFEGRRNDHGGSDLYALHVAAEAAS